MAQVQVLDGGATIVIRLPRAEAIATAAALEKTPLSETTEALGLLVGSPPWKRAAGEGSDGVISRGELTEYQNAHGLPVLGP